MTSGKRDQLATLLGAESWAEESPDDLTPIVGALDSQGFCTNDYLENLPVAELNSPTKGAFDIWVSDF